uniref:Uncharacterized protein LOC104215203 n=1 Tax=Nicotiana sylvestris TaxID=4096 RepID=A0A1U7VLN5_NICSY|nr:PREDICTED: uncharacterized protein LOC104215203 [Nicotiana sylvestris]
MRPDYERKSRLRGHIQTNCRSSRQGKGRGITHPSSSAAAISTTPPPAQGTPVPARRGATRGSTRSLGGPNRFYAVRGHQSSEASLDIVTGILIIQSHDVYALIDPSSSLSYVTPYVAMEFGIESEQLHESFFVSIPVGGSIVAVQVYRDCVVTVSPKNCVMHFGKKGKLSPRYVGPYRIIQRIGQVAYKLELPHEMSLVHLVFHMSMLKKVVGDLSLIVPVETIEVNEELNYDEIPVAILNRQVRKLRNKEIASVKVLWQNQQVEEATWEAEEEMKRKYAHLFEYLCNCVYEIVACKIMYHLYS